MHKESIPVCDNYESSDKYARRISINLSANIIIGFTKEMLPKSCDNLYETVISVNIDNLVTNSCF